MHIDTVGLGNDFIVPNIFDQVCVCQHLVAPLHHVLEQLEFAWPQINRSVATPRCAIDEIELQRSYAQYRFARSDQRANTRFHSRDYDHYGQGPFAKAVDLSANVASHASDLLEKS